MSTAVALLLVFALAALAELYRRRTASINGQTQRLLEAAKPTVRRAMPASGLPPPVARYLRLTLGERRQPPPRLMHLTQQGLLRTDLSSDRWLDFNADHIAAPLSNSFLWNAKVRIAPLVHVRVIDSLIDGVGSGEVHWMSTFEVAHASATPEVNSGSLHRFLAEAVWYPWALMPSDHLSWAPIDDTRALATLSVHGTSVSLEFRFARSGEVSGIFTPARWGRFGARYLQAAWEGEFRDYREFDGLLLPSEASVGWHRDGELKLVWVGHVDAAFQEL